MEPKKLLIGFIVILVGVLGFLLWLLFINFYSEPVAFEVNYTYLESQPSYHDGELQFYPNMRFNHNDISYSISEECDEEHEQDMIDAFNFLENKTGLLEFHESSNGAIQVNCGKEYMDKEFFVAGEGGPSKMVNTTLFTIILEGKILLLYKQSCNYNVALHELLHVLGFKHSDNQDSIMYEISRCNQVLTNDILGELRRLYSVEPLPDMHFQDISASKKGSLLNLNFTVKNEGLIDADNVEVILYTDGKERDSYELGKVEFGAGKIFSVTNQRISFMTKEIRLVILNGKELSREDNEVFLTLD